MHRLIIRSFLWGCVTMITYTLSLMVCLTVVAVCMIPFDLPTGLDAQLFRYIAFPGAALVMCHQMYRHRVWISEFVRINSP